MKKTAVVDELFRNCKVDVYIYIYIYIIYT